MTKSQEAKPKIGDEWMNPISGTVYKWDGKVWRSTGKRPYGDDPMGILQDGAERYGE